MYIQSDSCYCDNQCAYDPDGSYCYTHQIQEDEHNREIHNTAAMRNQVVNAIDGLINVMGDEFEFTEIHVITDPVKPLIQVYAKNFNGNTYKYRAYIDERGSVEFDG